MSEIKLGDKVKVEFPVVGVVREIRRTILTSYPPQEGTAEALVDFNGFRFVYRLEDLEKVEDD